MHRVNRLGWISLLGLWLTVAVAGIAFPVAAQSPALPDYTWRQIGPANMSGRIATIAVHPDQPHTIYVGASAGGVWKSMNNGTTWEQVFQGGRTAAIGNVAIAPGNPDVIYVGTGEPHSRNSVSWGDGVWRSGDGGRSWTHIGLEHTGHIGRIAVDPRNPDHVYVAALGNLWDLHTDRGLYKSTNGGRSWDRLMGFEDGTGFYEVQVDPRNPDTVYAASWRRLRRPWVFESGGGPHNGLWKSTNAGRTWQPLEGNGLPPSAENGKITLDIHRADPNILFARIENFAPDPNAPAPPEGAGQFAQRARAAAAPDLSGTYRSTDAGHTWKRVDRRNSRPFYFGQLRVDPSDPNIVYLLEVSLFKMDVAAQEQVVDRYDLGRGEDPIRAIEGSIHVDFHAMWINPNNSNHLVVANDGGVGISWDRGDTWIFADNLVLAQFYAVAFDMARPYNLYGGLQDNGTWTGPSATFVRRGILTRDWQHLLGGDGFHVQVDPLDPDRIVYMESQGGNINRLNRTTGQQQSIRPRPPQAAPRGLSEEQQQFLP